MGRRMRILREEMVWGLIMDNELEQLLEIIESQQIEIESMRKQIDDITELVILLMRQVKLR
jgi:hypothetical protein